MKKNKIFLLPLFVLILAICLFIVSQIFYTKNETNSLMMLIEFEEVDGILQWEKELDKRGLTALVKVQDNVLEENEEVFKRLAEKGYEIAGGYDEAPFWDMPYEEQYQHLRNSQELVERVTGKKMRVFGSRYFAYDENTLKIADDLGIEYILARGTEDVEAIVYKPNEYNVKIISVTNVDVGEMGRGSLCDYSLWARGSSPEDFWQMIEESVAKDPKNMILVSHSYLGGTRLLWWQEYIKALDLPDLNWKGFDGWILNQDIEYLNNEDIPINREVKYVAPNPVKQIEEYEAIPGLEDLNKKINSQNKEGEMLCQ
ncbi:MAG: polysaccharide deacetylase family protein [Patescibacteria group bacterium]|nr:polysaccharide deacetylase family protein [Patescibacteria group bacterium]MDD3939819.1 polysaccharide deacetylase family protein [Patescibacteria group bacterium]NCD07042.1 hypothetical protein [Spirochaetia bacterium]